MFVPRRAVSLSHSDGYYRVTLDDGVELLAKAVIIATGVSYRRLDVPGIDRFEGLSVFYSPVDADQVDAGQPVVIVGGGNSAGQAATALAASGHHVSMVVRGDALAETMSTYLLDRIERDASITVHPRTVVSAVHGERRLESVVLEDPLTGQRSDVRAHHLFVMIGGDPGLARRRPTTRSPRLHPHRGRHSPRGAVGQQLGDPRQRPLPSGDQPARCVRGG